MFQLSLLPEFEGPEPVPEISVIVLGVKFQAFVDPTTNQAVFSQIGVSRALKNDEKTIRRWLASKAFERLRGKASRFGTLLTKVSTKPISVVTQADLVALVQIGARRDNAVAKSMQDASFAVLLQESVDLALGIQRPRSEYLTKGATLRQQIEYAHTYHTLKGKTFENGHGVRGLCIVNKEVSSLAVTDADQRRKTNPAWRKRCSSDEVMRLTIGNAIATKAVQSALGSKELRPKLKLVADRCTEIFNILDQPF